MASNYSLKCCQTIQKNTFLCKKKMSNFQLALRRTILATEQTFNFSLLKRLTVKKSPYSCSTRNVRNLVEKSLKNVRHMSQSKLETIHQALPQTFLDFSDRQIVRILLYIWCTVVCSVTVWHWYKEFVNRDGQLSYIDRLIECALSIYRYWKHVRDWLCLIIVENIFLTLTGSIC
jgi:hypothetical protein